MPDVDLNMMGNPTVKYNLIIESRDGRVFSPPVKDEVKITWERVGVPGKLEFTTIKSTDGYDMSFWEGDRVTFYIDDKPIFMGYVFTKNRDKKHHINVTAYDQTRYLKNKFSYVFKNTAAHEIIKSLCDDFELKTGEFEDPEYEVPVIAEENKSAFDIILSVNEEVINNTGNLMVLYDDAGEIQYKNVLNMKVDTVIMDMTAEDFDYTSSIDENTYNSIVLYYKPGAQQVAGSGTTNTGTLTNDASFTWPTPGVTYITSPYGWRSGGFHLGTDIGASYGTPIHASKSGTVEFAGWHYSYGNYVKLTHLDGSYTLYAHMSQLGCSTGDTVSQQQVIGYVGSTGDSTGPHLHFELVLAGGNRVDPDLYVPKTPTASYSLASVNSIGSANFVGDSEPIQVMSVTANTRATSLGNLEVSGNEETIRAALIAKGYSSAAASAIMGNMYQESRMNPNAQSYDGGYGLIQWTGTRRTGPNGLIAWCAANGYDYTTITGQIEFMDWELSQPYFANLLPNFKNSTDVASATSSWLRYFEGIWDGTYSTRLNAANTYQSAYSGNEPSGGGSTSEISTGSDVQIFHAQDEEHIKEWGLLRYYEEVSSASIGEAKAKELLELYNRKTRTLRVTDAFGDINVRGGTLIPVILNLGDLITNSYMIVEKVVHTFTTDHHSMTLDLDGAWED